MWYLNFNKKNVCLQVENPSSNCTDGVLYGTGDFVRLKRENGLLYYEGRCDSQIKVLDKVIKRGLGWLF